MSSRSSVLIILIYSLILVGLVTRQGAVLVLVIPFVVYLLAGLYFRPETLSLQAERTLSARRVSGGIPITIGLKITNTGPSIDHLQIEDLVPTGLEIATGSPRFVTALKSGETIEFSYTVRAARGYYHLSELRVSASDHLGLFRTVKNIALSDRFIVLPEAYKLPEVAIRPRRTRVFPGLIPARKAGAGVEFFGLREYHPGDPKRWINSRVSARHEQMVFVNQFEQERAADVGLILDCRVETNLFRGNREFLEHGIQATATLAETFLNYGNRVGLLVYGGGRNWVHPGYGKLQRERILRALAAVRLYDYVVFKELSNLPTRLFPARAQLVLISSLQFSDLPTLVTLRAHGYRLLVVSPDPIAFEQQLLGDRPTVQQAVRIARLERQTLLRQLGRSGVPVFEWRVDQPFHLSAQYELTRSAIWYGHSGVTHA